MNDFTLDTSGAVHGNPHIIGPDGQHYAYVTWGVLSPFEQGYTTGAFRTLWARWLELHAKAGRDPATLRFPSFSSLAAETIVAIKKDCGARVAELVPSMGKTRRNGGDFWKQRQRGSSLFVRFPPVHLFVGDDGKVYAR